MKRWSWLVAKLQEWFANTRRQPPAAVDFPSMHDTGEPISSPYFRQPPTAAGPLMMLRCRDVADLIPRSLEEGTLDPSERQAFEAHLADCMNCWRFLQTYRETVALGQQLREEAMPPEVRRRLETFLRSRLPRLS